MFDELIKKALPGLAGQLQAAILKGLKRSAKKAEADKIAGRYARLLIDGGNAVARAAAAEKNVTDDQVKALTAEYFATTRRNVTEFADELQRYAPLEADFVIAERRHGPTSPQAAQAKAAKQAALAAVSRELREVLGE